jgi:hypothetical protein
MDLKNTLALMRNIVRTSVGSVCVCKGQVPRITFMSVCVGYNEVHVNYYLTSHVWGIVCVCVCVCVCVKKLSVYLCIKVRYLG